MKRNAAIHWMYTRYILGLLILFIVISFKGISQESTETVTDIDGNVYKTVIIGDQVWMAENLAWLPSVSPPSEGSLTVPYYYVYDYNGTNVTEAKASSNYQTYGVLYNWPAAMEACPEGWHLPTDDEWDELTDYLGGTDIAGGKLKETGTSHWNAPNVGATNETGFSALPGGYRQVHSTSDTIGYAGFWWSATHLNRGAWDRTMSYNNRTFWWAIYFNKELGFSVRCVKD